MCVRVRVRACACACACVRACARCVRGACVRMRAWGRVRVRACVRALMAACLRAPLLRACFRALACSACVHGCVRARVCECARAQARVLDVVRRHAVRPGPAANAGSFVADGWPHAGANAGPETKTCVRAPTLHVARTLNARTGTHARSHTCTDARVRARAHASPRFRPAETHRGC